jgi:hypothetical protein
MKNNLINEIKKYSIADLKIILDTQQDLYTIDEMNIIRDYYEKCKNEYISKHTPKLIPCPKCDAQNDFNSTTCTYCGQPINNKPYLDRICNEMLGIITAEDVKDDNDDYNGKSPSFLFQYIISFIIPLIGLIVGGVFIASDDEDKNASGKICIAISIISIIVSTTLYVLISK